MTIETGVVVRLDSTDANRKLQALQKTASSLSRSLTLTAKINAGDLNRELPKNRNISIRAVVDRASLTRALNRLPKTRRIRFEPQISASALRRTLSKISSRSVRFSITPSISRADINSQIRSLNVSPVRQTLRLNATITRSSLSRSIRNITARRALRIPLEAHFRLNQLRSAINAIGRLRLRRINLGVAFPVSRVNRAIREFNARRAGVASLRVPLSIRERRRGGRAFGGYASSSGEATSSFVNSLYNASSGVVRFGNSIFIAQRALATLSFFAGATGLVRLSEVWLSSANQIRSAAESFENVGDIQRNLSDIAIQTRQDINTVSTLYSRIRIAGRGVGVDDDAAQRIVATLGRLSVSSTPQETRAGLIQLSQGIASNRFSGDELRSVLENLLGVQQGFYVGFQRLFERGEIGERIDQSNIRDVAARGGLDTATVLRSLQEAEGFSRDFIGNFEITLSQSFQNLTTQAGVFFNNIEEGLGLFSRIANTIDFIGNNLSGVASLLTFITTTLISYSLLGRLARARNAAREFVDKNPEVRTARGALSNAKIQQGIFAGIAGGAAGGLLYFGSRDNDERTEPYSTASISNSYASLISSFDSSVADFISTFDETSSAFENIEKILDQFNTNVVGLIDQVVGDLPSNLSSGNDFNSFVTSLSSLSENLNFDASLLEFDYGSLINRLIEDTISNRIDGTRVDFTPVIREIRDVALNVITEQFQSTPQYQVFRQTAIDSLSLQYGSEDTKRLLNIRNTLNTGRERVNNLSTRLPEEDRNIISQIVQDNFTRNFEQYLVAQINDLSDNLLSGDNANTEQLTQDFNEGIETLFDKVRDIFPSLNINDYSSVVTEGTQLFRERLNAIYETIASSYLSQAQEYVTGSSQSLPPVPTDQRAQALVYKGSLDAFGSTDLVASRARYIEERLNSISDPFTRGLTNIANTSSSFDNFKTAEGVSDLTVANIDNTVNAYIQREVSNIIGNELARQSQQLLSQRSSYNLAELETQYDEIIKSTFTQVASTLNIDAATANTIKSNAREDFISSVNQQRETAISVYLGSVSDYIQGSLAELTDIDPDLQQDVRSRLQRIYGTSDVQSLRRVQVANDNNIITAESLQLNETRSVASLVSVLGENIRPLAEQFARLTTATTDLAEANEQQLISILPEGETRDNLVAARRYQTAAGYAGQIRSTFSETGGFATRLYNIRSQAGYSSESLSGLREIAEFSEIVATLSGNFEQLFTTLSNSRLEIVQTQLTTATQNLTSAFQLYTGKPSSTVPQSLPAVGLNSAPVATAGGFNSVPVLAGDITSAPVTPAGAEAGAIGAGAIVPSSGNTAANNFAIGLNVIQIALTLKSIYELQQSDSVKREKEFQLVGQRVSSNAESAYAQNVIDGNNNHGF